MNDRLRSAVSLEESAFWMPFTANRQFKKSPRMLARAEGMYYYTPEGREVLDGTSGLWCVNAGHCPPKIAAALQKQVAQMDFAPTFQMGHPLAFEFAERLAAVAPKVFQHVFFTNSGSESVDSALKISLAWHRARGDAGRFRLIGRERGYHGVNFGGISVGGIAGNRKHFGPMVGGVDHIRHTHDPARNAFTKGQPLHGAEFADDLERLGALHDAATIAAVIVEPVAGSTGVLIPPKGYLERLRELLAGLGKLALAGQRPAQLVDGFGKIGSEPDSLAQVAFRFRVGLAAVQHDAQLVAGRQMVRHQCDDFAPLARGAVGVAEGLEELAELVVQHPIVGLARQGLTVDLGLRLQGRPLCGRLQFAHLLEQPLVALAEVELGRERRPVQVLSQRVQQPVAAPIGDRQALGAVGL